MDAWIPAFAGMTGRDYRIKLLRIIRAGLTTSRLTVLARPFTAEALSRLSAKSPGISRLLLLYLIWYAIMLHIKAA